MNLQLTLDFLAELRINNNKEWFERQRSRYKLARSLFEELITDLIRAFGAIEDLGGLAANECMFRINRDVRFSNDKSPYKTTMSAAIGRGGRHGEGRSYYVQLAPGDSFIGGGMFEPDKNALDNLRQHIALDDTPLRAVIAAPAFAKYFGAIHGETLKTAPQGYDRNHPAIDLLRHKQLLAVHRFGDAEVCAADFVQQVVAAGAAMQPLLDYLDTAASAPPRG